MGTATGSLPGDGGLESAPDASQEAETAEGGLDASVDPLTDLGDADAKQCGPLRVLFIVDGSSSMSQVDADAGTTRWNMVKAGIAELMSAVPVGTEMGLMVFPGAGGGCNPGTVLVDVAGATGAQISSTLDSFVIDQGRQTPAGQSLHAASQYATITNPSYHNVVVFFSDGWQYCSIAGSGAPTCVTTQDCTQMAVDPCPSCNACSTGSSDPACAGQPEDGCYCVRTLIVTGVEALAAMGVETYVIGIGPSADFKTLNQAATSGGTATNGCDPMSQTPSCYLHAYNPSELSSAVEDIASRAAAGSCSASDP